MDLDRWSTQGCDVSGLFFKGAHEMVDFPGRCHIKILFLIFFFFSPHHPVVSDQVLLPSDLLSLKTVSLVTHTDTRPGQNRTETQLEIHKFST